MTAVGSPSLGVTLVRDASTVPRHPCSYSAPKAPGKPPFTFVLGAMPSKPIDLSFGRGFKALVFKNQPTNEYVIIPRHSPS